MVARDREHLIRQALTGSEKSEKLKQFAWHCPAAARPVLFQLTWIGDS
jgi:hypothetical protein